ncbi:MULTISPECIES: ATP-binding protein [Aurantimonas]|uniref:ATP-binding protein n=1 Tax=Aurantimonas TaxID=182269 RepID=UPI000A569045|nr:ATP-binding protein [Aurantimonas coralicida]
MPTDLRTGFEQLRERARREQYVMQGELEDIADSGSHRDRIVGALSPSARLLFDAIDGNVAAATRSRGERTLLVTVRVFSSEWLDTARQAVKASIRAAWPDQYLTITVLTATSESRLEHGYPFELQRLPEMLAEASPCLCLFPPDHEPQEMLRAISDAVVEIADPAREDIERLLGLGDALPHLPDGTMGSAYRPLELDFAVGRGRSPAERLRLLQEIRELRLADEAREGAGRSGASVEARPRIEDLHGYGDAGRWALQLVADLSAYRKGTIGWEDVDAGALFVGPPGTGKTLLAQAIANSAGVHFIATSYAQWQSNRSGHLGDVTKAIRAVFEAAAKNLPAIVFIDEIDTVQGRGGSDRSADAWFTAIVTCLLECLDGIGRREGVVVIAACNDDANLDAALLRSGRLDRRFWIDLPDEASLAGIFRHHLGDGIDPSAIDRVATLFAGTLSGADVVRIARDARRWARLAGRPLQTEDLIAVAVPGDERAPAVRRRIAIHEAGHAVARMNFGQVPTSLSLVETEHSGGAVVFDVDEASFEGLPGDVVKEAVCMLAGRAAEEVILGSPSAGAGGSASSDLAQVTRIVANAETSLGFGGTLVHGAQIDGAAVHRRLARLYAETIVLVRRHRAAIEALAHLALKRRVLGRAALAEFARGHGFMDPDHGGPA